MADIFPGKADGSDILFCVFVVDLLPFTTLFFHLLFICGISFFFQPLYIIMHEVSFLWKMHSGGNDFLESILIIPVF